MNLYDAGFFADNQPISLRSARAVLPGVLHDTAAATVIDVGCGTGTWLSVAKAYGCQVLGVDGNAPADQLLIDPSEFNLADISHGVSCAGADLALCLEVSEHLPQTSAVALVEGLTKARWVLFSPAHPGQGGVNHINEQWGSWWAELFARHDYYASSDLKWRHWNDGRVADYYRENLLFFARKGDLPQGYRFGVFDVIHPLRTGFWRAP